MGRPAWHAGLVLVPLVVGALCGGVTELNAQAGTPVPQIVFVSPYRGTRQIFLVMLNKSQLLREIPCQRPTDGALRNSGQLCICPRHRFSLPKTGLSRESMNLNRGTLWG